MSITTSLTRMWLTRSVKPFLFTNEYDEQLDYEPCENLGLYVHIPFCKSICTFCPYCKELYSQEKCNNYIDALLQEIHMVGRGRAVAAENEAGTEEKVLEQQKKIRVTSLYFGGGTPALAAERLGEVITTLKTYFEITEGIGVELHPANVTKEVLQTLQEAGVTKLSIGIQSFQEKFQRVLGRTAVNAEAMAAVLRQFSFETISMDFIFALPGQAYEDLKRDMELAFSVGANHVAIYPFIDFTFTDSRVPVMGKREKRQLLDDITEYCTKQGYTRTSIWTFAKGENVKYSSMTRDNFLGFGCSATTLLRKQFKINTFSVEEYRKRIAEGKLPTSLTIRFTERQRMVYYLFWTAYSTKVKAADFERFFGVSLKKMYGLELWLAQKMGFITKQGEAYEMTLKGAFYYHYYENFYTLSYIDKMWGIMRKEAFPERIEL